MWWFLLLFYADFWQCWNTGFICKQMQWRYIISTLVMLIVMSTLKVVLIIYICGEKSRLCGDSYSFCRPVTTSPIPTPCLFSSTSTGALSNQQQQLSASHVFHYTCNQSSCSWEGKSNYRQLSPIILQLGRVTEWSGVKLSSVGRGGRISVGQCATNLTQTLSK